VITHVSATSFRRAAVGAASVLAALAVGAASAQQQKCFQSKWGPKDEIGNANYLTPAKTLQGVKTITKGKAYRLGIETNKDTPAYPPRTFHVTIVQPGQQGGGSLGPTKTTYNDDILTGWVGVGSQIDGLGHIGIDYMHYNCNEAKDFAQTDGLKKLGIEKVPPIATRGILLDMAGYFNTDIVKEGTAFNQAEIDGAMKKQGVASIEQGDVVLFHTGWTKLIGKDNKRYNSGEPGLGKGGATYLASKGVVAVGADTWGVEVVPFEKDVGVFEVHQILLPINGIYILENMETAEMVQDKAWEFLFTLGPSRITGSVQAIINPIAIK
jgi:kynurenine formamidase